MTIELNDSTRVWPEQYTITWINKSYSISSQTALLTIMLLAVSLRLLSAVYQGNTITSLPGIYDQISYDGLARRVVDGHGFSFAEGHWPATRAEEPTAHWSYLYTLYLVVIYKFFGVYPLIARVIQAVIAGVFQTLLIGRIGSHLFNRNVGLIAAILNAIYIYFFYYAGALVTETFYITGILWTIDSALRLVNVPATQSEAQTIKWRRWLEFGLAIGVTVLLRQVFLTFLPLLFLWIWWNVRDANTNLWERRFHWSAIKGLTVASAVLGLMILPWTIRNYRAFGTFVLLNTNAGFALFWGNHPIYGTDFIPLLTSSYYDLIPPELRSLNEAELDKALLQRGIQFIAEDPARFLLLSVSRTREFFKFWPSSESGLISNISRVGSFGISLPFILYGLWLVIVSKTRTKTIHQWGGVTLLILFILAYTAVHLFSWALIRYRLPVDAVFLLFAAVGIQSFTAKYLLSKRT